MWLFYDLTIFLYGLALRAAAWFVPKARLWIQGRSRQSAPTLDPYPNWGRERHGESHDREGALAWFHCASLGEFEQGRPVIEAFRKEFPDWKILLTFFSPSGYEVRKDYDGADIIMYLPLDTRRNATRFIENYRPDLAVFVKYEFWYRYIDKLHEENIPLYLVSGIFRPHQHFFRWYGGWFQRQLKKFSHLFVQDENSAGLLHSIDIENVTVSGDTRFDRVAAIAEKAREFPLVEEFAGDKKVFLAGSTWPADEALILDWLERSDEDVKLIIAPHEVAPHRIEALCKAIISRQPSVVSPERSEGSACVRFSQLAPDNAVEARILIIDGIGYLSSLYQYATIAYIGGGFGVGIHNILEAATFGKPVVFGPKYEKFKEARDLAEKGGAFSVSNEHELTDICSVLLKDSPHYKKAAAICKDYVSKNQGATGIIMKGLGRFIKAR